MEHSLPQAASSEGKEWDRHVVERVLDGDVEVYRVLVERYRDLVLHYVFAMIGDAAGVEDLAEEGLRRAFHAIHRITTPGNFVPFALKETRAVVAKRLRDRGARIPLADPGDARRVLRVHASGETGVGASASTRALLMAIAPEAREMWVLRYVCGLGTDEIASITDRSGVRVVRELEASIQSLLRAARERMAEDERARAERVEGRHG